MVKSSIQSLEGQSLGVIILSCVAGIYTILGDGNVPPIPVEDLLKYADTVPAIVQAYSQEANNLSDMVNGGKIIAILIFMYKIYDKFVKSRTILKAEGAELIAKQVELETRARIYERSSNNSNLPDIPTPSHSIRRPRPPRPSL